MTPHEVEQTAIEFRLCIRRKAGLDGHWHETSESLKEWYRELARRSLVSGPRVQVRPTE